MENKNNFIYIGVLVVIILIIGVYILNQNKDDTTNDDLNNESQETIDNKDEEVSIKPAEEYEDIGDFLKDFAKLPSVFIKDPLKEPFVVEYKTDDGYTSYLYIDYADEDQKDTYNIPEHRKNAINRIMSRYENDTIYGTIDSGYKKTINITK